MFERFAKSNIGVKTAAASAAIFLVFAEAAQALSTGLDTSAKAAGYATGTVSIASIVGKILAPILATLGVVFMVLMIYAGFLYMTSQGNVEQTKKARGMMVNAAIGLIIIFASYAITTFVVSSALQATVGTESGSGT